MTYNGYTNYETWCVNLWLDNDEGTYRYIQELTAEAVDEDGDNPTSALETAIEDYVVGGMTDDGSVYSDLLSHALGMVDWREIAEGHVTTYYENNPTEEATDA